MLLLVIAAIMVVNNKSNPLNRVSGLFKKGIGGNFDWCKQTLKNEYFQILGAGAIFITMLYLLAPAVWGWFWGTEADPVKGVNAFEGHRILIFGIILWLMIRFLLFKEESSKATKTALSRLATLVLIGAIAFEFYQDFGQKATTAVASIKLPWSANSEAKVLHLGGGHYDKNPIKVPVGAKQKILPLPAKTIIRETLPPDARGWNVKDTLMSDGVTAWREGREIVISSSIDVPDEIIFNWW
ncbi:MAG: hypothetical protein HYV76_02565 [Candidatus Vogelbacteria bacterium]|nr:hypothetical protein [Candidatus Vogelbacteria bacterium]